MEDDNNDDELMVEGRVAESAENEAGAGLPPHEPNELDEATRQRREMQAHVQNASKLFLTPRWWDDIFALVQAAEPQAVFMKRLLAWTSTFKQRQEQLSQQEALRRSYAVLDLHSCRWSQALLRSSLELFQGTWWTALDQEQSRSALLRVRMRVPACTFQLIGVRCRSLPYALFQLIQERTPAVARTLLSTPRGMRDPASDLVLSSVHSAQDLVESEAVFHTLTTLGSMISGTTYKVECMHSKNARTLRAQPHSHRKLVMDAKDARARITCHRTAVSPLSSEGLEWLSSSHLLPLRLGPKDELVIQHLYISRLWCCQLSGLQFKSAWVRACVCVCVGGGGGVGKVSSIQTAKSTSTSSLQGLGWGLFLSARNSATQIEDAKIILSVVATESVPTFQTSQSFIQTLDLTLQWQLRSLLLSESLSPFNGPPGTFVACAHGSSTLVWGGGGAAEMDAYEIFASVGPRRQPHPGQGNRDHVEEEGPLDNDAGEHAEEEEEHEAVSEAYDEFVSLCSILEEDRAHLAAGAGDASSSSTSSSSSSSSDNAAELAQEPAPDSVEVEGWWVSRQRDFWNSTLFIPFKKPNFCFQKESCLREWCWKVAPISLLNKTT